MEWIRNHINLKWILNYINLKLSFILYFYTEDTGSHGHITWPASWLLSSRGLQPVPHCSILNMEPSSCFKKFQLMGNWQKKLHKLIDYIFTPILKYNISGFSTGITVKSQFSAVLGGPVKTGILDLTRKMVGILLIWLKIE